jgi:acetyl esterase/lipase
MTGPRLLVGFLSLLLFAASLLTAVKAPTLWAWKLAIVVGEFGHFALIVPAFVAGFSARWWRKGKARTFATFSLMAALASMILLLKPPVQAAVQAQTLPPRLEAAFGSAEPSRRPFSVAALFTARRSTTTVPQTNVFRRFADGSELALDLYLPIGDKPVPVVVVIHGGGWDGGDRGQFAAFNQEMARWGFAVAAVSYRLAPKFVWPAQRDDIHAALDWIEAHAVEHRLDSKRIVLLGRSAGGQLAQSVAYGSPRPGIRGVITLYGPADLNFAWKHTREADLLDSFKLMRQYLGGTPENVPAQFDDASPYNLVQSRSVPTLVGHGRLDALVWHRQSERLAERLASTGTPHVFLDLPWATHAFDYNEHGPSGQLTGFAIEWFLRAVTKDAM